MESTNATSSSTDPQLEEESKADNQSPEMISQQKETQKINEEYEIEKQKRYLGLQNQGATCYMNSLLQSLFMTHQFREKIFQWKYDQSIHGDAKDCLPLQLQILFARLQQSSSNHYKYIDTKALIDTFGWTSADMIQQQDVQEFCRVFFDAIEQSLNEGSTKDSQWIRDLYEGQTENFVHCKNCQNDSTRIDNFLDLQLIIRSDFDNVHNNSIEKGLKHLVKSVDLNNDNQYFCEKCEIKVDAIKGVRFKEVPPVIMLQLNRYELDYTTFLRKKICDRVHFPVILNLNEYFKRYEDIVVGEPPSPKRKQQQPEEEEESSTTRKLLPKRKASGEINNSSNAEDDIEDLFSTCVSTQKRPRTKSEDRNQKEVPDKNEESISQDNHQQVNFALFGDIEIPAAKRQQTKSNKTEEKSRVSSETKKDEHTDQKKTTKNLKVQVNPALISKIDEIYEVAPEYNEADFDEEGIYWGTDMKLFGKTLDQVKPKSSSQPKISSEEARRYHFEENIRANTRNVEKVQQFLKDGPNVYELYAVNVHSGGAQGGHYFSYIKSFENGQWYNFDDYNVTLISEYALEKVEGDTHSSASHNTSAYMLMYRKVDGQIFQVQAPPIPEDVLQTLQAEEVVEEKKREQAKIAQELKQQQIDIRVYKDFETSSSFSFNRNNTTFEMVKLEVMEKFQIQTEFDCWRLRGYSFVNRTMLESFSGKESEFLSDLQLPPNLIIETKAPNEEFEDYDPLKIALFVNIWKDEFGSLESIDRPLPVPTRLMIRETETIKTLVQRLAGVTSYKEEEIIILKKSNRSLNFTMMCVNDCEESINSTLNQIDIFNNSQIYVEKQRTDQPSTSLTLTWAAYMERQSHICRIAYNIPSSSTRREGQTFESEVIVDNRCTLRDAKNLISKKLNIPTSQFIMKKTSLRNQEELKDLSVQVRQIGFLNRGTLFLSLGTPSSIDEFNIEYRNCILSSETSNLSVSGMYESSFLFNYNTPTYITVLELKETLVAKLEEKGITVKSPKHIRLRVRLSEFKGIMKNDKTLREYQLYDRKVLGVTILDEEEDLQANQIVVCYKVWDSETRLLKPPAEVTVETGISNFELIKQVSTAMGGEQLDGNDLEVYLVQSMKSQNSLESIAYDASNWKSYSDNFLISHSPWFLNRDGELLIVRIAKDFSENKELIEEYLKKLSVSSHDAENYLSSKLKDFRITGKDDNDKKTVYKQHAEVALKINLKKNKVEPVQKSQPEELKEGAASESTQSSATTTTTTENPTTTTVPSKEETDNSTPVQEEISVCYPPQSDVDEKIISKLAADSSADGDKKSVRFDQQISVADYYEDEDAELQRILLASLKEYEQSNPPHSNQSS